MPLFTCLHRAGAPASGISTGAAGVWLVFESCTWSPALWSFFFMADADIVLKFTFFLEFSKSASSFASLRRNASSFPKKDGKAVSGGRHRNNTNERDAKDYFVKS